MFEGEKTADDSWCFKLYRVIFIWNSSCHCCNN